MSDTLTAPLTDPHPQILRKELRSEAKADPQKLADLRPMIGRLVERAFALMGITKQDAAYRMHYSDPGTISRWCAGTERPLFDKLFSLDGFVLAYVLAIAENHHGLTVRTTVTIDRTEPEKCRMAKARLA